MKTAKSTYWQDAGYYLGFLNDYPDYQTQGMSKEELVGNLIVGSILCSILTRQVCRRSETIAFGFPGAPECCGVSEDLFRKV